MAFETEKCSRCQGTGKYSFCAEYRDTCFKCNGSGKTYTKRGLAARAYLNQLRQKLFSELEPGDRIEVGGVTNSGKPFSYIAEVIRIDMGSMATYGSTHLGVTTTETYMQTAIETAHPKYGFKSIQSRPSHTVTTYSHDDQERLEKALQYQDALTKAGLPRKRSK